MERWVLDVDWIKKVNIYIEVFFIVYDNVEINISVLNILRRYYFKYVCC